MVEITKWVECRICENRYCSHSGEARFIAACSGYTVPKKPQTNADRIRAMSDGELAAWLMALSCICECCARVEECIDVPGYNECKKGATEWLKQPAKDGGNE